MAAKSLLEQLPEIVKAGKRQAQQILEQLEGPGRVSLQTRELVIPARDTAGLDVFGADSLERDIAGEPNRLIYGDNLLAMAALLAGDDTSPSLRNKVDLIYIDPPFDSKADYRTKIVLPGTEIAQGATTAEQFAYSDAWANGTASYLEMITPRLVLMRELLSETGSICVQLDWHVSHYVKLVLDEVFGKTNFRNEIVWHYGGRGAKAISGQLPRNHDVIFWFSKSPDSFYNRIYDRRKIPIAGQSGFMQDGDGQWFKTSPRGDYTDASIERLRRENRIYDTASGGVRIKYYVDSDSEFIYEDALLGDVWEDIPDAMHMSKTERLDYSTQKPLALLKRVIDMASPAGGVIADFFVGSGTTAEAAELGGRKWIVSDQGKPAVMITRKRLVDFDAKPFLYQAIGDYQVEQARSTLGRKFKVGELAQTVLSIYGALPLSIEENVNGSLGYVPGEKTLVVVDSPSRLTTVSTLRRAQAYRDSKMGGFERVLVLGWNFAAGIAQDLTALDDDRLDVRVIPPDLLDRLKKRGKENLAGEIRFATLQYLEAHVESSVATSEGVELEVDLDNYVLLSPDAISLAEGDRAAVLDVMNREPLALIEYWAVDPDYDGEVFRSTWQDYRGNTANDGDALRTVTRAHLVAPPKQGDRSVCVRAIDVFGFESEVIIHLNAVLGVAT
jgi:adenine-specific DNA-methyltransferase